jgi:hypothetical protein
VKRKRGNKMKVSDFNYELPLHLIAQHPYDKRDEARLMVLDKNKQTIEHKVFKDVIDYLKFNIVKQGKSPSLVSYFDNSIDLLKSIVLNNYNLVICVGTDSSTYNYNIKENLAKIFDSKLEKNLSCEVSLKKYCNTHNIPYTSQEEMQGTILANAVPLCDGRFYNNGFT